MNQYNKDAKLVMYMHAGSGNHGCEAIVNSTCHMIQEKPILMSYFGSEDQRYSLPELCEIKSERRFEDHQLMHVLYYACRKLTGDEESFIRYRYGDIFRSNVPLAISIGGDNYCYDSMLRDLRLANYAFKKHGTKTVLLGCSIEPELLKRPEIAEDLMQYHTIIARESITYNALKQVLLKENPEEKSANTCQIQQSTEFANAGAMNAQADANNGLANHSVPNILLYPDPAFTLPRKDLPLPEGFIPGNTIGINVSPMIRDNETVPGITMDNYRALIRFILDQTDSAVALIPHVIWQRNDDRGPIHELYEEFKDTGRVIEIGDATCEELKGFIARCRLFVGARTHATIAAYSSLVPTLVVGYSVKARGIARDLFDTEEHYVLPVQSLKHADDLTKEFQWLLSQESAIYEHLMAKMPDYIQAAYRTGKEVDRLWEEFSQQPRI